MILAYAPFLLAPICPISMDVMMFMMKGKHESKSDANANASADASHKISEPQDAVPGKV